MRNIHPGIPNPFIRDYMLTLETRTKFCALYSNESGIARHRTISEVPYVIRV